MGCLALVQALEQGSKWHYTETTLSPRGSNLRQMVLFDNQSVVVQDRDPDCYLFQDQSDATLWSLPVFFAAKAEQVSPGVWAAILEPSDFDRESYYNVHSNQLDTFLRFGCQRGEDGSYPPDGHPFPVHMTLRLLEESPQ